MIIYHSHFQQAYPKVFLGLDTMQGEYTIKLRPNATPRAIHIARNFSSGVTRPGNYPGIKLCCPTISTETRSSHVS